MRARFFAPTDEDETRDYLRLGEHIETFWQRFYAWTKSGSAERLSEMHASLAQVHPDLIVELLSRNGDRIGVVRHAERLHLRPLAELVVASAPRLDDWKFTIERPRSALPDALALVCNVAGFDLAHASIRLGIARGHSFEVVLKSHRFGSSEDLGGIAASQLLLSLLLGDDAFDTWVGSISVLPGTKPGKLRVLSDSESEPERFMPLTELVPAFDAGVAGVDAGLSEEPYHRFCEHADWTLLDVEPALRQSDYAAQDDLALCSTMLPEMLKCFLQGGLFSSRRFSKHGEVFVYLKYQSLRSGSEARLEERQQLEDLLNRVLVPGALGCVVGGGLGARYGYVDLALQRLDAGIALIRRVLASQAAFQSAWILFCDSSLRDEWVAIADSAAPPLLPLEQS